MLKFLLLLLLGFAPIAYSQADIKTWQANHPDVLLMNTAAYNGLSSEIREQLKDKIVVYEGNPSVAELEKLSGSDEQKSMVQSLEQSGKDDQFIKNWLGTHQDIKIVPRSVYEHAAPQTQSAYTINNALILTGETITIADIQNYNP